jgi:hypothetical protein
MVTDPRRRAIVLAIGLGAWLSGCVVWPTMTWPGVRLTIRDTEGRPIEGASVHLAQYSISMVPRSATWRTETDERGSVTIDGEREWQLFILAPDSGQFWSWSWCIEKAGFRPAIVNDLRAHRSARNTTIELTRSADEERCRWREQPPAFEVERR